MKCARTGFSCSLTSSGLPGFWEHPESAFYGTPSAAHGADPPSFRSRPRFSPWAPAARCWSGRAGRRSRWIWQFPFCLPSAPKPSCQPHVELRLSLPTAPAACKQQQNITSQVGPHFIYTKLILQVGNISSREVNWFSPCWRNRCHRNKDYMSAIPNSCLQPKKNIPLYTVRSKSQEQKFNSHMQLL